jgi:hypothetical protein
VEQINWYKKISKDEYVKELEEKIRELNNRIY